MKKVISVILGTLMGILLAEILTRVYVFGWAGLNYSMMKSYVGIKDSDLIRSNGDSLVLYDLKPNLKTTFRFHTLKTNEQGLRDEQYTYSKEAKSIRIAIIGDSYTMGWGVERKNAYPDLLQKALNQKYSHNFEVINFGVPGYDLKNYLGVLRSKANIYHPDLILVGFCEKNDFDIPKPFRVESGNENRKNGFFRSYFYELIRKTRRVYNMKSTSSGVDEAYLHDIFEQFQRISQRTKTPIVVVNLSIDPKESRKRILSKIVKESGLLFIDGSGSFEGKVANDFTVNNLDSHPNEKAHYLFTMAILKSSEFSQALGPKAILNK